MVEELPIFISAEQLQESLDVNGVQVVAVDSEADYAAHHIPGALRLAMADFTASEPPVAGLLPDDTTLAAVFSNAGLRNDAQIVAYDRVGDGQAARLLYTLDAVGHHAISLLDGGLAAWHEAGFDLNEGPPPAAGRGDFQVDRKPDRIADRAWIESKLDDAGTTFLDVRSAAEYAGNDVRSARGGHIPGAINLDWNLLRDGRGRLRPRTQLLQILSDHDIDKKQDIVHYCQSHTRSSYTYLVLKWLGYDKVRGYPGAWSDWGNAMDTPVDNSRQ